MFPNYKEPAIVTIDSALDYFTLDGIRLKVGVDPDEFGLVILKDRLDNHISAAEKDPNPRVYVNISAGGLITGNNGQHFPIRKIPILYDPHYRSTSKILPLFERGFVGHYLKVEAGIQSLSGKYVVIVTKEKSFRVRYERAGNTIKPLIEEVDEKMYDEGNVTEFHLPMQIKDVSELYNYAINYACCNPHVTFVINGKEFKSVCKKSPITFTSARWFENQRSFINVLDFYSEIYEKTAEFIREFTDRPDILEHDVSKKPLRDLSKEEKIQLYNLLLQIEEPQITLFREQDYIERLKQVVGEVKRHGYATQVERSTNGSFLYALEVFAAEVPTTQQFFRPHSQERDHATVICCVNSSPLFSNIWYGSKGTYYVYGDTNLFGYINKTSKGECNFLIVNLLLPKPPWTSYSKSELHIGPYLNTFKSLLKKALLRLRGPTNPRFARKKLEEEILRRIMIVNRHGKIPDDEWITQNGLWYKIRRKLGGVMDISRKSFLKAVGDVCLKYGYTRDELGITCAPRGELYYGGKVYALTFENINHLASLGTDIVHIEKEGVPRALKDIAKDYPIAFTHSRGFIVEYGQRLFELAQLTDANIVMITDLDDAGLAMQHQVPWIIRIGVNEEMLRYFGLREEDLREEYKPGSHLTYLEKVNPSDAKKVRKYRIEIDSVLAEVGPSQLLDYIIYKLKKHFPRRNYNRAINVAPVLPKKIDEFQSLFNEYLKKRFANEITFIKEELASWEGLERTSVVEESVKKRILEKEISDELVKEITDEINALIVKIKRGIEDGGNDRVFDGEG